MVLSIEMPAGGEEQVLPMMKMVMQIWTAKPEEALRLQAVRELTAYNLWTGSFMNPAGSLAKMFGSIPVVGKGLTSMFDDMAKNKALMLRTNMSIYSSFFAKLAQGVRKQGQPLPENYDPDAPFIQVKQEAAELSTASLEDSIFQVPGGYETVPMDDLMKVMLLPKK